MTDEMDGMDPVRLSPSDVISSGKFQRSVATYLEAAQKRALFISRGQEIDTVVLSLDEYRILVGEQHRLEEMLEALVALKRTLSFAMDAEKRTFSTEEVMAELGISQEEVDAVPADDLES
jgi:hypothetical protein